MIEIGYVTRIHITYYVYSSGVVPVCLGCMAVAPPDFDRSCPPNYYWHPWIFKPSDCPVLYNYLKLHI